jgi:hypothetical protein
LLTNATGSRQSKRIASFESQLPLARSSSCSSDRNGQRHLRVVRRHQWVGYPSDRDQCMARGNRRSDRGGGSRDHELPLPEGRTRRSAVGRVGSASTENDHLPTPRKPGWFGGDRVGGFLVSKGREPAGVCVAPSPAVPLTECPFVVPSRRRLSPSRVPTRSRNARRVIEMEGADLHGRTRTDQPGGRARR